MEKKGLDKYPRPSVTVDMVIFTIINKDLQVLLIQRMEAPFKDAWALPGGFVRVGESLEDAVNRELREETGIKNEGYMEQLYTFGETDRDPRGRVITVAYVALINSRDMLIKASTDARNATWVSIKALPKLAFDHANILSYAIKRIKWKLEYTNVAYSLLPPEFKLSDLQSIYEIIFDRQFDKRNFRKKINSLGLVAKAGKRTFGDAHRPAELYKFIKRKPVIFEEDII